LNRLAIDPHAGHRSVHKRTDAARGHRYDLRTPGNDIVVLATFLIVLLALWLAAAAVVVLLRVTQG
jgi:hypothetical protein